MAMLTDIDFTEHYVPFTTFVVKVVSRCNLNCSYCYMYNLQDSTYRSQPGRMKLDVAEAMAGRIREHLLGHGLKGTAIILHGGEPLLMGRNYMRQWLNVVQEGLGGGIEASFNIQSNGVLIDDEWISFLADSNVRIGLSIDGPRSVHDRFRLYHDGRGSYDDVVKAIRLLNAHPRGQEIFTTVMSVVNLDVDPDEVWAEFKSLGIYGFDISLPHANHAHPPPGGRWTYRDWLIRLFDLWFDDPQTHGFRYFENVIRMLAGYPHSSDNIGGKPVGVIVVETNGDYEGTDALKCTEHGMTKLGLGVVKNPIDAVYDVPMVAKLQQKHVPVCGTCQDCRASDVCGGGYLPHRYSTLADGPLEQGFNNPSIYCNALYGLIEHAYERLSVHIEKSRNRAGTGTRPCL
ncbi:radical SAM protein [Roseibium polysiphoniae]|uniref:Radical SAM protein n=1 Tax=Roseibium polysiphoniae TaxID=2571221 RepID=A0ABR9CF21_9HYPH|nr:radical SAM protein [Roseibium polysiphoniae]